MSKLNKPVSVILMTILLDAMGVGTDPGFAGIDVISLPNATLADATLWGGILATIFALMHFCSAQPWVWRRINMGASLF